MTDLSLISQALPSVVGGLIGGGFALAGGALTIGRTARHERNRVEREDLVRLAAEMIRNSDSMWVTDIDQTRAAFRLVTAGRSSHPTEETLQAFRDRDAEARRLYTKANDTMRSRAAEMRLRQPGIAEEAEALWQASIVPSRDGDASMNPTGEGRRAAESVFIAKVRARIHELQ